MVKTFLGDFVQKPVFFFLFYNPVKSCFKIFLSSKFEKFSVTLFSEERNPRYRFQDKIKRPCNNRLTDPNQVLDGNLGQKGVQTVYRTGLPPGMMQHGV